MTDGPLVIHTEWPPLAIIPVKTEVPEPDEDDNDPVVPCAAWFFFLSFSSMNVTVAEIDTWQTDLHSMGWRSYNRRSEVDFASRRIHQV